MTQRFVMFAFQFATIVMPQHLSVLTMSYFPMMMAELVFQGICRYVCQFIK